MSRECDCPGCSEWGEVCEVCQAYEPSETFRAGGISFEVCDSCIIRVRRESKRLARLQTERATARNLLRDKQVRN